MGQSRKRSGPHSGVCQGSDVGDVRGRGDYVDAGLVRHGRGSDMRDNGSSVREHGGGVDGMGHHSRAGDHVHTGLMRHSRGYGVCDRSPGEQGPLFKPVTVRKTRVRTEEGVSTNKGVSTD